MTIADDDPDQADAALASRPILQGAFRLDDQPAGAEQPVAEEQREARQHARTASGNRTSCR